MDLAVIIRMGCAAVPECLECVVTRCRGGACTGTLLAYVNY